MNNKQFAIVIGTYVIFAGGIIYVYKKFLDKIEETYKSNSMSININLEELNNLKEDLKDE